MGNRQKRLNARELWKQGWTATEIAREINVNVSTIRLWIRDVELTQEEETILSQIKPKWFQSYKQGKYLKQNGLERRMTYQEQGRQNAQTGSILHLMGSMLYWGEGSKSRGRMMFINTDPYMLKLFMRFLREELKVENELINIQIIHHTTDESEVNRIKEYWLDWLELPPTTHVSTQVKVGTDSRKARYLNGMCSINVYRTEVVQHIFGAIQEYIGFTHPKWGK